MKTISKIAAIALVAAFVVGASVSPVKAATVAELQAMIASLSAQIAALSGTTTTTPAAVTFTSNLTVGSKGAEVTALQNFLIGKGYNTLATGYFGPMTKAALAAYQTAKGITPAAGYFGPLTRTSVNGEAAVTTTTTTTGALTGGDGDFSKYSVLGTPSNEDVNEGQSVKVYAVEFTAKDSDLKLERAKITLAKVTGTVTKPWKVLKDVAVYNGSTKIGNIDASDSNNWDETANGSNVYDISVKLDSVVKADAKVKLYVEVTANSSLDTADLGSWSTSITTDNLRAVNAEGINVYEGSATTKNFSLVASDAGDMSITVDASENKAAAITVDDANDTNGVVAYTASVKSKTGDNTIETVTVNMASSDFDAVNAVRLFMGSDEIGSESASTSVVFDDLSKKISEGSISTLVIKLDLNDTNDGARYVSGTTVRVGTTTIAFVDANDDDQSVTNTTLGGVLTLSTTSIKVAKTSVATPTYSSATKTDGEYYVTFSVTAPSDDDIFIPISASSTGNGTTSAGVGFTVYNSSNVVTTATTSLGELVKESGSATEQSGYFKISQNNTATFKLHVVLDNLGGTANAAKKLGLTQVNYSVGTATAPTASYTTGLDEDYRTSSLLLYAAAQN